MTTPRTLLVLALAASLVAGCGSDDRSTAKKQRHTNKDETRHEFVSRPDLEPPIVQVNVSSKEPLSPGFVFMSSKETTNPGGPMIVDNAGEVVWFDEVQPTHGTDFRVQTLRGKPVLTWWQGKVSKSGVGVGKFVIADQSYERIAEFPAGNGLPGDLHEFEITAKNTGLVLAYPIVRRNLRSVGGPRRGFVYDNVVQEVALPSGKVLWQWRALDHVAVAESMLRKPAKAARKRKAAFDYFHVNSAELDDDGNVIISARNTHTVYKIDRTTGEVIWKLGGKDSSFQMGPGTKFGYQHDARRQADGTLTIFDNSATPPIAKFSRVLVIRLDEKKRTATLVRSYVHPKKILTPHQGNAQFLPDGHVFVGWGGIPNLTEYGEDGDVLLDLKPKVGDTYRAYRMEWVGQPKDDPSLGFADGAVYASWNGATEVRRWELLAGDDADSLESVATVDKDGFETAIDLDDDAEVVAVRALDEDGRELGRSRAVEVP